jgi:glucokinase
MYEFDERLVLTLDAGGTNFVFSALRAYKQIVAPITLPAVNDDLEGCLDVLEKGFRQVLRGVDETPAAISFAFPGPADYKNGVIGDLPNFKAFRGGVPLGPYLEEVFGVPVFINNDGNLFAYGEAIAGGLNEVNNELRRAGVNRVYKNLIGITLGTGFGAGVVIDGVLLTGDNGCGGDVWCMRNNKYPKMIAEESVSIRAVKRVYEELSGVNSSALTPKDICDIAEGTRIGDAVAARESFAELGRVAGEAIANVIDITDGVVVIGGGIAGASKFIFPSLVAALNGRVGTFAGDSFPLLQSKVYNWEDPDDRKAFIELGVEEIPIPRSDKKTVYIRDKALCVCKSRNGASSSVMFGAYAYALRQLDKNN